VTVLSGECAQTRNANSKYTHAHTAHEPHRHSAQAKALTVTQTTHIHIHTEGFTRVSYHAEWPTVAKPKAGAHPEQRPDSRGRGALPAAQQRSPTSQH
jgi:hypothetical protein